MLILSWPLSGSLMDTKMNRNSTSHISNKDINRPKKVKRLMKRYSFTIHYNAVLWFGVGAANTTPMPSPKVRG